jgi:type IV pilus assembly protein PilC
LRIDLNDIKKNSPTASHSDENVLGSILKMELSFSVSKELTVEEKEEFYSQFGVLISSGLDIVSTFDVLRSEKKSKKYDLFLHELYNHLVLGSSISQAAKATNKISLYEYYTLKVGEETGKLADVLGQLSKHYHNRIQQRRNLINALSYPVILLATSLIVVVFMLNFIVPMFEDLFKRFNGDLPALTKFIIQLSDGVKSHLLLIIGIIVILIFAIASMLKKRFFKVFITTLILRIPRINVLVKKIYIAKFCQLFALLSGASIPIVTSLQLIKKIIGFYPYEVALEEIEQKIVNGSLLYEAMAGYPIFDAKLISLTKVGEEVNRLNDIYNNLSQQYSSEVEFQLKKINTLLEPFIIVVIGGLVALILISMYLPMFKMSNSVF